MKGFATTLLHGGPGLGILAPGALIVLLLLAAAATTSSAVVLSGSLRTSLYLQESRLGAGTHEIRVIREGVHDTTHVPDSARNSLQNRARFTEEIRLDAIQLGAKPLGFHTSFSAGNILTDQSLKETTIRLYRAYFQWNKVRRGSGLGYDLRLGRQWVLAGVGSGTVDGLSAKLGDSRFGDLTVFGGTLGTDRMLRTDKFWSLDKTDQSRSVGGRLRLERPLGPVVPQLAFSVSQRERRPNKDLVIDARRFGVHAEVRPSRTLAVGALRGSRVWSDLRRDLVWGNNLSLVGGLDVSRDWHDLRGRIEYGQRRADLPATSRLAVFAQDPRKELRGGIGAAVARRIRLDLEGDYTAFADPKWSAELNESLKAEYVGENKEKGITVTASGYGLSLGYRFSRGAGGDLDGLVFYGHRDLFDRFTIDGSIGVSTYDFERVSRSQEFDDSRSESSGILALGYELRPDLTLTGQVEGLQNDGMNHDVRFLGIVNWRFRTAL